MGKLLMKRCLIWMGITLLIPLGFAQKPADFGIKSKKALKYYLEGKQFAQWRDRARAVTSFQAAVDLEPDFAHAHYELGLNEHLQKNFSKALPHFQKAYEMYPREFGGYYYAEALFYNAQYEAAIPQYETYINLNRGRKKGIDVGSPQFAKGEVCQRSHQATRGL